MKLFIFLIFSLSIANAVEIPFSIYHTNDLHSHFEGVKSPNGKILGGYARLTETIKTFRETKLKNGEIVLGVDAGDFFSGTVFSGIALSNSKDFPEYEFFKDNFFDAVALGNHEFDATNRGLEIMFKKIKGDSALIATNLFLKTKDTKLKNFFGNHQLIKRYIIKEYNDTKTQSKLKIAFLAVLGPDGCHVSKALRSDVSFIGYDDQKASKNLDELSDFLNPLIKDIKEKEHADIVVLSMHGGGQEATDLAKKLNGLDIIIAGHTHEVQFEVVNDVIISQTGSYGENLGILNLIFNTATKKVILITNAENAITPMDEKVASSPKWKKLIADWKIESLKIMGDDKNNSEEIVFTPDKDYLMSSLAFNSYGTFFTTGIREQLNKETNENIDLYFTVSGLIRSPLYKGVSYTRSDIFEISSVGFDQNLVPGVDVVSFYLTAHEVKLVISFLEIYSRLTSHFSPVISENLTFDFTKWGIPFLNRITDFKLNGNELEKEKRLIKVATNRYVIDNLATIENATHGFIKIDPKDKDGKSTRDYKRYNKEYKIFTNYLLGLKH